MLGTVGATFAFYQHQAGVEADDKARSLAADATAGIVERVRSEFSQSFRMVTSTNEAIAALWIADKRERSTIDVLIKQMLGADPDRFGAWTAWKRDAFDGRDKDFAGKAGSDATGRYLTYWHQNGMEIALDAVSGADDRDNAAIQVPIGAGTAYLSEPAFIQSNDRKIATVSYSEADRRRRQAPGRDRDRHRAVAVARRHRRTRSPQRRERAARLPRRDRGRRHGRQTTRPPDRTGSA